MPIFQARMPRSLRPARPIFPSCAPDQPEKRARRAAQIRPLCLRRSRTDQFRRARSSCPAFFRRPARDTFSRVLLRCPAHRSARRSGCRSRSGPAWPDAGRELPAARPMLLVDRQLTPRMVYHGAGPIEIGFGAVLQKDPLADKLGLIEEVVKSPVAQFVSAFVPPLGALAGADSPERCAGFSGAWKMKRGPKGSRRSPPTFRTRGRGRTAACRAPMP